MLKIALIIMVVVAVVLLLALIVFSVKLLRKAEQEQSLNKKSSAYQLHPKLKQQHLNQKENEQD